MNDRGRRRSVLLVEADPVERERLGGWLEGAGYEVVECSGPVGPDYTCVGSRAGECPLVDRADAIVLDLRLEGEDAMAGTPVEDLLSLYVASERPVVALGRGGGPVESFEDARLVRLRRRPDRADLLESMTHLLQPERDAVLRERREP